MTQAWRGVIIFIVIFVLIAGTAIVSQGRESESRILAAELTWIITTTAPQTSIAVASASIRSDLTLVEFFAGY